MEASVGSKIRAALSSIKDEDLYEEVKNRLILLVEKQSGVKPKFGAVKLFIHDGHLARIDFEPSIKIFMRPNKTV